LAFAFALGFVVFGVGSGTSGITEAMQSLFHRNSGSTSVSSLQHTARAHPNSATAWRNLATRLETDQKTDRAALALNHYLKLRPKDEGALQELAGLYTTRASAYYTLYSQYSGQAQLVSPNSLFRPPSTSKIGEALASGDPILSAENTTVQAKLNSALQQLDLYNTKTVDTYKRPAKLAPQNATYQLQLGETASNVGDTKTAETAYKTFLKLAPNDPLASLAKKQLKALAASAKAKTATATTSKSGG